MRQLGAHGGLGVEVGGYLCRLTGGSDGLDAVQPEHPLLAGALALVQRGEHAEGGHQRAASQVRDLAGGLDRRAALLAGKAQ